MVLHGRMTSAQYQEHQSQLDVTQERALAFESTIEDDELRRIKSNAGRLLTVRHFGLNWVDDLGITPDALVKTPEEMLAELEAATAALQRGAKRAIVAGRVEIDPIKNIDPLITKLLMERVIVEAKKLRGETP